MDRRGVTHPLHSEEEMASVSVTEGKLLCPLGVQRTVGHLEWGRGMADLGEKESPGKGVGDSPGQAVECVSAAVRKENTVSH